MKYNFFYPYIIKILKNIFPRQSLKRFTFHVKSNDSIFFLLGLSPIAINLTFKVNLFKPFMWKILFNSLRKLQRDLKN